MDATRLVHTAMPSKYSQPTKAYNNREFLESKDARPLRILAEYMEPQQRFETYNVEDTIVLMGSARLKPREDARAALEQAEAGEGDIDVETARHDLEMSQYYEAARDLAHRVTLWSKQLDPNEKRFVVCTGGGPGIMEAANRGASEARGMNIGLSISLPHEQHENPYVTRELGFEFHYFFMRKFWFTYLAKGIVFFPGGFGTLDELFEMLTLLQTAKIRKHMPIVLFGTEFWESVVNFKTLARYGTIDWGDLDLVKTTDSVEEAYAFLTHELTDGALPSPGAHL